MEFNIKAFNAILKHAKGGCIECRELIEGTIAESHEEAYKQ